MEKILFVLAAMSASVFAAVGGDLDYRYDCYPPKSTNAEGKFRLEILSTKKILLDGHKLSRDTNYRPRAHKNYVRFEGDTLFITGGYADGVDILIHEGVFEEEDHSYMKIQSRGEGFFNDFYNCYLR